MGYHWRDLGGECGRFGGVWENGGENRPLHALAWGLDVRTSRPPLIPIHPIYCAIARREYEPVCGTFHVSRDPR